MNYDEFVDKIDDQAWRKKEISEAFLMLNHKKNNRIKKKAFILLLCAHFEAFFKEVMIDYFSYIEKQKIKPCELTKDLHKLHFKHSLSRVLGSNIDGGIQSEERFDKAIEHFVNGHFLTQDEGITIAAIEALSTKKWSIEVILSILQKLEIIDVFKDKIELKGNLLDNFFKSRNSISHEGDIKGPQKKGVDRYELEELKDLKVFVVILIEFYIDTIKDFAYEELYLSENSLRKKIYIKEQAAKFANAVSTDV